MILFPQCSGDKVALVIIEFPDVFVDRPGTATGWEHKIITSPPDMVVWFPLHPVPFTLQEVLQQEDVTARGDRGIS